MQVNPVQVMDSGTVTLILIFFAVLVVILVGACCHFRGAGEISGGCSPSQAASSAPGVSLTTSGLLLKFGDVAVNGCQCVNTFKGKCLVCHQAANFVNDGNLGAVRDFSKYGGDKGFDLVGREDEIDEKELFKAWQGKVNNSLV